MTTSDALWPKFLPLDPPLELESLPRVGNSVVKNSVDLPMGGRPFSLLPWYSYVPVVSGKNPTPGVPSFFPKFFVLREQFRLRVPKSLRFEVFSPVLLE